MFAVVTTGCGAADPRDDPTTDRGGPSADWLLADGAASCVEEFSVENLSGRSWAFDGTVAEVIPPKDPEGEMPADIVTHITFGVNRWYKGGDGHTVTVLSYHAPGVVSSVENVDAVVGARILASGEDRYLWSCGFSMLYSAQNAALFERAFGG